MFRQGLADRLAASGARFRALSTASKISLLFLVFVALVAVFAPWVATHDPLEVIARMRAPSAEYWFGTDRLGRDIFSRIVYGAQTSLFIGLGAVACAIQRKPDGVYQFHDFAISCACRAGMCVINSCGAYNHG